MILIGGFYFWFADRCSNRYGDCLAIMGERERIKWINDEDLYQPKIHSERIKELYKTQDSNSYPNDGSG